MLEGIMTLLMSLFQDHVWFKEVHTVNMLTGMDL